MKRIHIFRSGRHTAASGQQIEFSEADLAACAAAYDPSLHEAPIVVGHPASNRPAYGWIRSLSAAGVDLHAEPYQVHADFEDMVQKGAFKKVSASFYLPDAPSNPKPGTLYLRHVGFLGAHPPAVKGLKPVEFAEQEEGVIEFADATLVTSWLARTLRSLREFFIEKHGMEDADKALPSYMVELIEDEARRASEPASFEESNNLNREIMKPTQEPAPRPAPAVDFAEEQRKLQEERTKLEREKAELAKQKADARRRELAEFVEALVKGPDNKGRVLPVHKNTLIEALVHIDQVQGATVEFGEGDQKEAKPLLAAVQDFLRALPVQIDYTEKAPAGRGEPVDVQDAQALADAALEFQEAERKKGRTISISQAVDAVKKRQTV